jgi:hypothetical protein
VAVTAAAVVVPALAAGAWLVRGADDPLQRGRPELLPAFARAELQAVPGLRVLALSPRADGSVGYELTGGDGARLGVTGTPPEQGQTAALDAVVADLLSARGSDATQALATRAVRYVALPPGPAAGQLREVLDQQPGLSRRSDEDVLLWELAAPAGALTVLPPEVAETALAGLPGPERGASALPEPAPTVLPAGEDGRLLVLSAAVDDGWVASLDGRALPRRTAWGWAQAFELPEVGGTLQVGHDDDRGTALALQALAVLLVAVLAAPGARRRRGLEIDDPDDRDDPGDGEPVVAASRVARPPGRHAAGAWS